ncbi:hypothetical protein I79_014157 [Cricetulus griseus]|uniref:Uncharacterized protein n=1 Tax=Cricetulus griseus TaxID=10029 RepID=G3HTD2_CRIGR|nr:hypothetical protein I79_014157 [Cricetulus griseus]
MTQRSTYLRLPNAGIKGMCHHCPHFLCFEAELPAFLIPDHLSSSQADQRVK